MPLQGNHILAKISWLHLSDLHFGADGDPFGQDVDRGEKEYLYEGVRTLNSQISRRSITSWVANQIEPPCWKGRKHFAHFGINSPTMPLVAGRRMDLLASVVSSLGASGSVSWKAGYRPAPGASGTRDSLEDGTVLGVPAEESPAGTGLEDECRFEFGQDSQYGANYIGPVGTGIVNGKAAMRDYSRNSHRKRAVTLLSHVVCKLRPFPSVAGR